MSPDYEEAGLGQLSIKSGAFIHFDELKSENINSKTSTEEALRIHKNSVGGYYDKDSIKLVSINDKEVITYDSGHTTDGVSAVYKTEGGKWLIAEFTTKTSAKDGYNAQESPHYATFTSWLEEFVKLN